MQKTVSCYGTVVDTIPPTEEQLREIRESINQPGTPLEQWERLKEAVKKLERYVSATKPMEIDAEGYAMLQQLLLRQETDRQKKIRQILDKLSDDNFDWPTLELEIDEAEFLKHQLEVDLRESEDALRKLGIAQ